MRGGRAFELAGRGHAAGRGSFFCFCAAEPPGLYASTLLRFYASTLLRFYASTLLRFYISALLSF
ncbi:putative eAL domain protein [Burkholderia pseudomallei]|nr:putative eAL domain protein [Burkholderia pseudomallei]